MRKKPDDLLDNVEKYLCSVLADTEAMPEDKIQASNSAIKLLQIKHKISGLGDNNDSFFGGKK